MGFLSKLAKATFDVVTLPVDIVKDVVTMGGVLDNEEPCTIEKLKKVTKSIEEASEDLGEGDIL